VIAPTRFGVTELLAVDDAPMPTALVAYTANVYVVPLVKQGRVREGKIR
jgi:hypothetical protein